MSDHKVFQWFYYYPLLEQTSGVVTMDPGGYANVVCASQVKEIQGSNPPDYRICLVNYTHLGPSQRCSRGGIAPDMQCCNTRYLPNAHWCDYTNPSDDDSIPVLNLTTSIEGKYQCQVWNPMMEAWQSIGDPVQVIMKNRTVISTEVPVNTTEIQEDTPSNRTTPFLYPFVAAVCLLCVLILILLVIIFTIFIKCRRTKSHSTANYEELLRDNLLGAGVIGVTETELSVCTHSGPGIRCREVDSVFSEETQVTADQLPKFTSEFSPYTVPTVHVDGTTAPTVHVDSTTVPTVHMDGTTAPTVHMDGTTAPTVHVDGTTVPTVHVDGTTVPTVHMDGTTVPTVNVDSTTVPTVHVDGTTVPTVHVDGTTVPTVHLDSEIVMQCCLNIQSSVKEFATLVCRLDTYMQNTVNVTKE